MARMWLGTKQQVFQLQGQTWLCKTELTSDAIIEVGEMSFHLHKFPLISRSELLQKMLNECDSNDGKQALLDLNDIPGGAKAFQLVASFCYDVKIELSSLNVVALRCASEFLQMTEEQAEGNLISQTESFLEQVLGNWNDSITALQTCKDVLRDAEELLIVSRCINSLASKACSDPTPFGWPVAPPGQGTILWNGIGTDGKARSPGADWWYTDVTFLELPIYKRLILVLKSKGMKAEDIARSLMHYAKRCFPGLIRHSSYHESSANSSSNETESDQRPILEQIVELLPAEKGAASSKFLTGLLRTAMFLQASPSCREDLERRVGAQLEDATLENVLIQNLGYSADTIYDVECMQRILEHFISVNLPECGASPTNCIVDDEGQVMDSSSAVALTPMTTVAKLVDGYLAEVGSDVSLKLPKFQSLAALIPDYARSLDDGIYRAVDIYLKSHPWLTDAEREQLCRLMNCQKLSLEACTHAAQNERLPLRVIIQVLFFEQLRLRTTIAGWFFDGDNMDNSHGPPRPLPKNSSAVSQAEEEAQASTIFEEMRSKVPDLEKEYSDIRGDIQKLQRSKSGWSILGGKLGVGIMKLKRFSSSKQSCKDVKINQ